MKLTFLGAAGTVTGSKTLVTAGNKHVLVDCGLFQGFKNLRLLNWTAFPFDVQQIDAVVLTHAHLDHSGALPLLVKQGYQGPIYATASTIDLCAIMLLDSAKLQEEEANFANKHQTSDHHPAQPLYTTNDAKKTLRQFKPLDTQRVLTIAEGISVRLRPAGHILGACSAEMTADGQTVLFSGDLGRSDDKIMQPPAPIERPDYIVVESTYGDRCHDKSDPQERFAEIVNRTVARGGMIVVPSFAVGRAQELLLAIFKMKQRRLIPDLPVYLNSPMAIDMTEIYMRHCSEHRLSKEDCIGMGAVAKMIRTVEASRELDSIRYPSIIISASGMATGGRVLHHIKALAPDHRNTILFAGFQAGGTRGARMIAGEKSIRIYGEDVPIHAEIASLSGMSAHADADQIMAWLKTAQIAPKGVYLTHGEPAPADALRLRIKHELGWPAMAPLLGQTIDLGQAHA
jgi:metallo-beta-lactamase family protein